MFLTTFTGNHLNVVGASSPDAPKIDKTDVEDAEMIAGIQPLGGNTHKDAVHALNREKYQLGFQLLRVEVLCFSHHAQSSH